MQIIEAKSFFQAKLQKRFTKLDSKDITRSFGFNRAFHEQEGLLVTYGTTQEHFSVSTSSRRR